MKTRYQKTPWSRRIIGIVATVALACTLLPIGAIVAFGDSEALVQALKLVQDPEGALAEDVQDETSDPESTDGSEGVEAKNITTAEDETTDGDESDSETSTEQGKLPSVAMQAFLNTYQQILAVKDADDAESKAQLAELLDVMPGLYASLSDEEQALDDIASKWAEVDALRVEMPDGIDVEDASVAIGDTGYESLQAAINAAKDGDTIVIKKSLELEALVSFDKNVTLDLNENELTVSSAGAFIKEGDIVIKNGNINFNGDDNAYAFSVAGGSLTIDGATLTSDGNSGVSVTGGTFAANNTTISCENGYGVRVTSGATATISGGTITAKYGVFVANENSDFTMTGGEINATYYGIVGNGLSENGGTNITISGDAKVNSSEFIAIYQPQSGTLNIEGGTFTGNYGAIGIKSGDLNISGGTFEATNKEEYKDFDSFGNGIKVWGSVIHIDSHSAYADDININISGGTFTSANGYLFHEVANNGTHVSSLTISGGSFNTAVDVFRLESAPAEVVTVTGGTFNHMIPEQYRPSDYMCNEENGVFTVTTDIPAHEEHEWNGGVITVEPTCTTPGVMTYTCNKGGETYDVVITAKEHEYDEAVIITPATCEEAGERVYTCKNCNLEVIEEIPALGHSMGDWKVFYEPTCEVEGQNFRSCSNPGCVYEEAVETPATGHNMSEWSVFLEPTCESEGEEFCYCMNPDCATEEFKDISALGHQTVNTGYVEATCSAEGYTGDDVCSVCDKVVNYGQVIPMLEHNEGLEGVVTPATCTHKGTTVFSCVDCGAITRNEVIPMLEHNVVIDSAVAPTCASTGLTEGSHCQECNAVLTEQSEVRALGHDWVNGTITKAATCSEAGVMTYSCSRCAIEGDQEIEIDPEAHSWGAWIVVTPAAVGVQGSEQRVCAHDGAHAETRAIAALAPQVQTPAPSNDNVSGGNAAAVNGSTYVAGGAAPAGATGAAGGAQAIADDETPLASGDEVIADEENPLAAPSSSIVARGQEGIDWFVVGAAVAGFLVLDGIIVSCVLLKRRRSRLNQ